MIGIIVFSSQKLFFHVFEKVKKKKKNVGMAAVTSPTTEFQMEILREVAQTQVRAHNAAPLVFCQLLIILF